MNEAGTLESFFPAMSSSPVPNQTFSRIVQTTTPSSKSSPSPKHRIIKNLAGRRLASIPNTPDLANTRFKARKNSSTPTPNPMTQVPKIPKKILSYEQNFSPTNKDPSYPKFIQLNEKVRNELMLEHDHHIIRSIKKNMRSDEYNLRNMYLDSTQLFNRLSTRMENPSSPIQPFKVVKNSGTGKLIHKKSVAQNKVLTHIASDWVHKHGKLSDSISLKSTARVVFDMLDPSDKGEITGQQFCEFLIEIGFPLEIFTVFTFLKQYKYSSSIENVRLSVEDISNFCRADHRTNSMLVALYTAIGELNSEKFSQIDIISVFKVVKGWWEEIDVYKAHLVHCNVVCVSLVAKGVACDFREAFKITSKCAVDGFVDFAHFQLVFVKGFVKHMLVNIQFRFKPEDWTNHDFSNAYKLCQLKKQLILAGILYPVPQISFEEGLATLEAIQKYNIMVNRPLEKIEYSDFCKVWKDITGEILGKSYTKKSVPESGHDLDSFQFSFNSFSVMGNTSLKVGKTWQHSFSPKTKLKEFVAINKNELRLVNENKLFKRFCEIVNNEGYPISN